MLSWSLGQNGQLLWEWAWWYHQLLLIKPRTPVTFGWTESVVIVFTTWYEQEPIERSGKQAMSSIKKKLKLTIVEFNTLWSKNKRPEKNQELYGNSIVHCNFCYWFLRITDYPKLEGTHQDHWAQSWPCPRHLNNPTLCLRVLSKLSWSSALGMSPFPEEPVRCLTPFGEKYAASYAPGTGPAVQLGSCKGLEHTVPMKNT